VELARPNKLNALNPEMVEGLLEVFEGPAVESARGVFLTGQGRATCAGMDTDIVSGGDYETEYADLDANMQTLFRRIEAQPAPVAMAGRGALVGAGAVLSLSCEFLVLGEETTFAIPEVAYGITSERAAAVLPDLAGRRVTAEVLLTGEELDPARAKAAGLANDVVPEDDVVPRAREYLETVAEHDEATVRELVELLAREGA
jgi:enoyl-CoA hydratase/carnithine racemase